MSIEAALRKNMEAFNRHDAAEFAAAYTTGAVAHDPQYPQPLQGRTAIRKDIEDFMRAFPDMQGDLRTVFTDGNNFASEALVTGTHKGPLAGPTGEIPATGKRVEMSVAFFGRTDPDGRIVEERRYYDLAGMMSQLGLTPES